MARARASRAGGEVAHGTPCDLRHTRGTEIAAEYGPRAAQAGLGHAHLSTTDGYLHEMRELAREVARGGRAFRGLRRG